MKYQYWVLTDLQFSRNKKNKTADQVLPAREGKDSIEKEKNEWNSHGLTQVAGYEKLPSIS